MAQERIYTVHQFSLDVFNIGAALSRSEEDQKIMDSPAFQGAFGYIQEHGTQAAVLKLIRTQGRQAAQAFANIEPDAIQFTRGSAGHIDLINEVLAENWRKGFYLLQSFHEQGGALNPITEGEKMQNLHLFISAQEDAIVNAAPPAPAPVWGAEPLFILPPLNALPVLNLQALGDEPPAEAVVLPPPPPPPSPEVVPLVAPDLVAFDQAAADQAANPTPVTSSSSSRSPEPEPESLLGRRRRDEDEDDDRDPPALRPRVSFGSFSGRTYAPAPGEYQGR